MEESARRKEEIENRKKEKEARENEAEAKEVDEAANERLGINTILICSLLKVSIEIVVW